jgi:hypothetical protein
VSLYAIANNYEQLVAAMRERRIELGLSQVAVDHLAGWADGLWAKYEARLTNPGAKNVRAMGAESLPIAMRALGMHLAVFTEDVPGRVSERKDASLGRALKPRAAKTLRIQQLPLNRIMSERGRAGGLARAANSDAEHRQALAKKAAAARWAGHARKQSQLEQPARAMRPKPAKNQAAKLRKRLVEERATAKTNPAC